MQAPRLMRAVFGFCALATLLTATAAPSNATTPDAPDSPSTDVARYFTQCHAVRVCNGSVLVTQHGKVIYQQALGDADASGKTPLTVDDQFDIGSVSKQFAAAAVLRLTERGALSLDAHAIDYLPALPYPGITLRQLLNHTSGLPDVFPLYTDILKGGKATKPMLGGEVVQMLADHKPPLRFEPGSAFEYSNTGYMLLAQIVVRVTGMDYADFMQREFFVPLGMRHTRVRTPGNDAQIRPRAYGFVVNPDGTRRALDQIPGFYPVGPGDIYSTTGDLQQWANALAQGRAMSKANWALAVTPAVLANGTTVPYGMGFKLTPSALGAPMVTHGGDWRGFKADFTLLPAQGVQIFILTNNGQDDSVEAARDAIEAILAGRPRPQLRESVHWQLLKHGTSAQALETYLQQEWTRQPQRYDFPGQPLEQVGDQFLKRDQPDQAIAVLKFNRDVHPTSLDALDALADAYLATGNRVAAIEQVQAMLKIKPESRKIRQRLEQLEK